LTFEAGTNIDIASVEAQNRYKRVEARLPDDVRRLGVPVTKPQRNYLMFVVLTAKDNNKSYVELGSFAATTVLDQLRRVKGVGEATHGQHNRLRAPGSLGGASTPSRVFKGMRMAGRTGGDRVKITNLKVLQVVPEKNLLVISVSLPGRKGAFVYIEK